MCAGFKINFRCVKMLNHGCFISIILFLVQISEKKCMWRSLLWKIKLIEQSNIALIPLYLLCYNNVLQR